MKALDESYNFIMNLFLFLQYNQEKIIHKNKERITINGLNIYLLKLQII